MQGIVAKFPDSMQERSFIVRTTLDPNIQRAAEIGVELQLRQYGRDYNATQAAMVVMEISGAVRAMVGGRDYGESQFNRAIDAQRQPGSSFKPYVYITALLAGYKPSTIVLDAPLCIGNWCPRNYSGGFAGPVTLINAITRSLNTVAVRVAEAVGRDKIIANMRKMGVVSPIINTRPLPLGAADLTVLEHTRAYAHFASGGMKVESHAALEIKTPLGEVVWTWAKDGGKPVRILPASAVADMNIMLHNAVENGTGRRARIDGVHVAGKTGTTNAWRDGWFMGYSGTFVAGIWMGNDDYSPTRRMTGGSLPAMTWQKVMSYAHQGVEPKQIPGLINAPVPRVEEPKVAATDSEFPTAKRPITLSPRAAERLLRIEKLLRDAAPAVPLPTAAAPGRTAATPLAPAIRSD